MPAFRIEEASLKWCLALDHVALQIIAAVQAGRLSPAVARLEYYDSRNPDAGVSSVFGPGWRLDLGRWDITYGSLAYGWGDTAITGLCRSYVREARIDEYRLVFVINRTDALLINRRGRFVAQFAATQDRETARFMKVDGRDWQTMRANPNHETVGDIDAHVVIWLHRNVLEPNGIRTATAQPANP